MATRHAYASIMWNESGLRSDLRADIYCACDAVLRVDARVARFIRCPTCNRLWELDSTVEMHERETAPDGAAIIEAEGVTHQPFATCALCGMREDEHNARHMFVARKGSDDRR